MVHPNLLLQRKQSHHSKGLFQTLKHWSCCLYSDPMIQLVTLIDKSLDIVRNVPTFRHQLIESSGITLLLLQQKTNLFVVKETRIISPTWPKIPCFCTRKALIFLEQPPDCIPNSCFCSRLHPEMSCLTTQLPRAKCLRSRT